MIGIWMAVASAAPANLAEQVALHLRLDGVAVDEPTLAAGYAELCKGKGKVKGNALACDWKRWDADGRVNRTALAAMAGAACTEKATEPCLLAAWASGLEPRGLRFTAKAPGAADTVARLEQACEGGSERACSELGVVLSEGVVTKADHERAAGLQAAACDAGVVIACERLGDDVRAEKLGSPRFLPIDAACKVGVVSACEAVLDEGGMSSADRAALLERLCNLTGDQCLDLADARAGQPASLPTGPIADFWIVRAGVLMRGPAADYSWLPMEDVASVQIRVAEPRNESVALTGTFGTLELPTASRCESVVRALEGVRAAGHLPRAVDTVGHAARSACVTDLGPGMGPPYIGGDVRLEPQSTEQAGVATSIAAGLHHEELFRCAEANSTRRSPEELQIRVNYKGAALTKPKVLASSGIREFDACVARWLTASPVPAPAAKAKLVVVIDLFW